MKNIRRNSITGIVEASGLSEVSMHFSEWWNGEGFDFNFDENKRFSLHTEEIHALFVAMVAVNAIDLDAVINDAYDMRRESADREEAIRNIRK